MTLAHHGSDDTTVTGEVAAVVFRNERTGFGVVEIAGEDAAEGARAAGPLSALVEGQPVRLRGRWTEHERYGETFTTIAYEIVAPQTEDGLSRFLASTRFPGVGLTLADRLVATFGLSLADVVTADPDRLTEVAGVSAALAGQIATSWREAGALPELVARLAAAGVAPAAVTAFHLRHGAEASAVLDADPYRVLEVPGVRWAQAEQLARAAGLAPTDARRLAAAAVTTLALARDDGHVTSDSPTLRAGIERLTNVVAVDARRGMDRAAVEGRVVHEVLGGDPDREPVDVWSLPADRAAEESLAADLARLLAAWRGRGRVDVEELDPELTAEQRAAVGGALTAAVSVLTGGPGTGKTRTVRAVVSACREADLRLALCAPTGRAAKRLEELTGHPATTVHRLLEAAPAMFDQADDGGSDDGQTAFRFAYSAGRRLPHDLVVVDEVSMADTALLAALLEAVADRAGVLLVGDSDQLPSVGPGAVLRDVLAADPAVVPRTHLSIVHRQAARSRIVTLAHELRAGRGSAPPGRHGDVFSVPQHPAGLADRVAEIVAVRAPEFYGLPPTDVQVLAPMYRGPGGVDALNTRLAARLNPPKGRPTVAGFREGDRVVQTRNDAELDVANGEVGEVVAVEARRGVLTVAFPAGRVDFRSSQARNLRPAWCLTVHKSQGGEWPVVVLALDPSHRAMLYRELVYTAVTRARRGLLLVGRAELLEVAAARAGSGLAQRRTALNLRFSRALAGGALSARRPPGGEERNDGDLVASSRSGGEP